MRKHMCFFISVTSERRFCATFLTLILNTIIGHFCVDFFLKRSLNYRENICQKNSRQNNPKGTFFNKKKFFHRAPIPVTFHFFFEKTAIYRLFLRFPKLNETRQYD